VSLSVIDTYRRATILKNRMNLKNTLPLEDQDTFDTLMAFGFGHEDVSSAFSKNKGKKLESLLDWLIQNNRKKSSPSEADATEGIVKFEEKKITQKVGGNIGLKGGFQQQKDAQSNFVAELSEEVHSRIKNIINEIHECISKDPNEIILFLTNVLKKLKFSGQSHNRDVLCLCDNDRNFTQHPLLMKMRSSFYQILERAFNKKAKKSALIEINSFEYAMLMMAEMKLLSEQQLNSAKGTYIKFCKKLSLGENELLLKQLESGFQNSNVTNMNTPYKKSEDFKIFKDKDDKRKTSNYSSDSSSQASKDSKDSKENSPKIEPQNDPSKFKVADLGSPIKEEKKEGASNNQTVTPSNFDKENCLICMERTREIVFLPCSHFLTCPLCAPKLTSCPICNKKLEKHLKIFWC